MKSARIVISEKDFCGDHVRFTEEYARYVQKVLRLKAGDRVHVLHGGHQYLVRLEASGRTGMIGHVEQLLETAIEDVPPIVLGFGCVRPGPFGEILRHGTELGVYRFAPLITARSNRKPVNRKERWELVVASAVAQSGRIVVPEVERPSPLDDFFYACRMSPSSKLVLTPAGEATSILACLKSMSPRGATILVGPEGGLTSFEETEAVGSGFLKVRLNDGTLRTETAALAAVGILSAWYSSQYMAAMPEGIENQIPDREETDSPVRP